MSENGNYSGSILMADNDPAFLSAFSAMLEMRGYRTTIADTREKILGLLKTENFDLITLDLDWGHDDYNGITILRQVLELVPPLPVIMITEHGSIATAVEAIRIGAFNYIEKMHDREKTLLTIKNAIESGRLKKQNLAFLEEIRKKYEIIGGSAVIEKILGQINLAAPTDSVVLITGESGTGKELVARQIHYQSRRAQGKFVTVDSGTLTDSLAESELFGHRRGAFTGALNDRKGLFEVAENGTLFLDEISNADLNLQAKLLHVLQEKEYRRVGENEMRPCNVRIIAATNRKIPEMIKANNFRQDLYWRLKVIEIEIPPLSDRKEDIPLLARHFIRAKSLKNFGREYHFAPEAISLLADYNWPGNVRELENCLERIIILAGADEVSADDVKSILGGLWMDKAASFKSLNEMTQEFRRECIIRAINLAEGKIARAAEILQIDRTHLYKLINEYQLKEGQ